MTTVTFQRQTPVIVVKANEGASYSSAAAMVSLQNQAAASSLTALNDIVVDSAANGNVLQYSSVDNKYHIKPFNLEGTTLDGGSF